MKINKIDSCRVTMKLSPKSKWFSIEAPKHIIKSFRECFKAFEFVITLLNHYKVVLLLTQTVVSSEDNTIVLRVGKTIQLFYELYFLKTNS